MSFLSRGPWESGPRQLELPMKLELGAARFFKVTERRNGPLLRPDGIGPEAPADLTIGGEVPVRPDGLESVADQLLYTYDSAGNAVPAQVIDCPEIDLLVEGAECVGGAISFALGVPMETMSLIAPEAPSHLIPENVEDERLLAALGTDRARAPYAGTRGVEVFRNKRVDAPFIEALARRKIPSIYEGALGSQGPAVRFRALWRVLEFSFQSHGQQLVELLVAFAPARELGFDRRELEELRTLRGRLSHAASRAGLGELRRANAEAIGSLGRLWSLVDWVILCKQEPGRTPEVEKLKPLEAYIDRDGAVQVPGGDEEGREKMRHWSEGSPRFRSPTGLE